MDFGLQSKKALVTGGSRGIGKAIARELSREGADVAIAARTLADLEKSAREIEDETGRPVVPLALDVTRRDQVDRVTSKAAEALGGLHILVNSGSYPGGSATATGPIETVNEEDLLSDFDVKYVGALRCARSAIPFMKQAGWGRIIKYQRRQRTQSRQPHRWSAQRLLGASDQDTVEPSGPIWDYRQLHPPRSHPHRAHAGITGRPGRSAGHRPRGIRAARLCSRLPAKQRYLPYGGRLGDWVFSGLPGVRQSLGHHRRGYRGRRWYGQRGLLLNLTVSLQRYYARATLVVRNVCNDWLIGTGAFPAMPGFWRQPLGSPAFHPSFQGCWFTSLRPPLPIMEIAPRSASGDPVLLSELRWLWTHQRHYVLVLGPLPKRTI